jgi:hypothetical protein
MNSALKTLRAAIELRLRRHSNLTVQSMKKASACIAHLQLHGCIVQTVIVRRDHVTVEIDQPSNWLRGSNHITRVNGRYREIVKVAAVHGCQVQWVEREAHVLLQREG